MDRLALEKEKFEAILERFEADVGRAKELGDYSQTEANTDYVNSIQVPLLLLHYHYCYYCCYCCRLLLLLLLPLLLVFSAATTIGTAAAAAPATLDCSLVWLCDVVRPQRHWC
jgi:hypothetical protein